MGNNNGPEPPGFCNHYPWLPWCNGTPPPPPPPPEPCEGPGCLTDPWDPYDPDQCTRTCEPIGTGEDTVWKCSYTCGTPQVNAFINWADIRISELQAWIGPLVDQFFGMGEYALSNLDEMKDLFRDMIAQFTNFQNLEGIRIAIENINEKLPTLEQFQEAIQELLNNIVVQITPADPNIVECNDILKPQCWANIWNNLLGQAVNPPTIPPIPTASRPKRIGKSVL